MSRAINEAKGSTYLDHLPENSRTNKMSKTINDLKENFPARSKTPKATEDVKENPYLAHLPASQRYTGSTMPPVVREPLYGFLPRRVKGEQVRKVLVSNRELF